MGRDLRTTLGKPLVQDKYTLGAPGVTPAMTIRGLAITSGSCANCGPPRDREDVHGGGPQFEEHPWLIGKVDGTDPGDPGGGEPTSPPIPGSGAQVRELKADERLAALEEYLKPTFVQQVVMEMPMIH
jgi:hypothetical protein